MKKYRYYFAFSHGDGQSSGSGYTTLDLEHHPQNMDDFHQIHKVLEDGGVSRPTVVFFKFLCEVEI